MAFTAFILTEIKFHFGWYVLCKQCPKMKPSERKHLHMLLFHQNKDSKSKDQNKNEFDFISLAMKTIVNRTFSQWNKVSFPVSWKHSLSQSLQWYWAIVEKSLSLHCFCKQLRSGLSLHRCFYFQDFQVSKLLKGYSIVWPTK